MTIENKTKQELIQEFARHDGDTGSPEVQIAILTTRITQLTDHLRAHISLYQAKRLSEIFGTF